MTVAVMGAALGTVTSSAYAGLAFKAPLATLLEGVPATPLQGAWSP